MNLPKNHAHRLPDDDPSEKIDKMVTLTVAAARGLVPSGQVNLPLAQIAQSPLAPAQARDLAQTLLRILKGERDAAALAAGLVPEFAPLIQDVLDQIEAPEPEVETQRTGLTFAELLEKVAEACTGEVLLWQQLWNLTEELSADERLPADIHALGVALRKILAGERQPHVLADLSPEHRWGVAQLLDWLLERSATPGESPTPD